ncbi:hypothetical protein JW992_12100 [candidate division KSB1 bacterium]|nr:hypothetical protein [candidate division KSB1 bacterium]
MKRVARLAASCCLLSGLLGGVAAQSSRILLEDSFRVPVDHLTVKLDIDAAQVRILKNDNARSIAFRIKYDESVCGAEVEFDESSNRFFVRLQHDNWQMIKDRGDRDYADVEIRIPNHPRIDFLTDIKAGEIICKVGDLRIANFELHSLAGRTVVDFDRPNLIQMENLDIGVKFGEVELLGMGNAGFKQADINGGVGKIQIDFSGEKIDRSTARIDLDVGETTLVLPKKVGIKLKVSRFRFLSNVEYPHWFIKKGNYHYSQNYNNSKRSLYLLISAGIGDLSIKVQ